VLIPRCNVRQGAAALVQGRASLPVEAMYRICACAAADETNRPPMRSSRAQPACMLLALEGIVYLPSNRIAGTYSPCRWLPNYRGRTGGVPRDRAPDFLVATGMCFRSRARADFRCGSANLGRPYQAAARYKCCMRAAAIAVTKSANSVSACSARCWASGGRLAPWTGRTFSVREKFSV